MHILSDDRHYKARTGTLSQEKADKRYGKIKNCYTRELTVLSPATTAVKTTKSIKPRYKSLNKDLQEHGENIMIQREIYVTSFKKKANGGQSRLKRSLPEGGLPMLTGK